jgi:hypothetical protein
MTTNFFSSPQGNGESEMVGEEEGDLDRVASLQGLLLRLACNLFASLQIVVCCLLLFTWLLAAVCCLLAACC